MAMNIPYSAIPIAEDTASGSAAHISPPNRVPALHPRNGPAISPAIKGKVSRPGSIEAIVKISSVTPKEAASLCGRVKEPESF